MPPAFTDKPYTDPGITLTLEEVGNLPTQPAPSNPPARTTLPKQESAYDVEGRVTDVSGLTPQDAANFAESFWVFDSTAGFGKDPYRIDGQTGQDWAKNQS
jgi:hypothetical protein